MLRLPLRSYHKHAHAKASSPPAKRAASEPVSNNRCVFGLKWSLCFICLQNSCMMLLTVVPLIWFACLLFVFFSERFPFICRAGLCWAAFLCTGTVFGAPRAENENAKWCFNRNLSWPHVGGPKSLKLKPKLAPCWRPEWA